MAEATTKASTTARRGNKAKAMQIKRAINLSSKNIEDKLSDAKGRATKARARIVSGSGEQRNRRLKLAAKLHAVLVNTPADKDGMVPDTPFTQAGVARMMERLGQRAGDTTSAGGKVAGRMVKFLSAEDGEDAVAGASVKKLQLLATRTEKLKSNFGTRVRDL